MCPFEKRHFLTWIDLNPGFGRQIFTNGTFKTLQMKAFGPKKFKFHPGVRKCHIGNFLERARMAMPC